MTNEEIMEDRVKNSPLAKFFETESISTERKNKDNKDKVELESKTT